MPRGFFPGTAVPRLLAMSIPAQSRVTISTLSTSLFACVASGFLLFSPRFTRAREEPRPILSLLNEVTGEARAINDRRRSWFGPR